ncbi:hypothetical protein JOL62DRAFT_574375, partial [Phyllosticta paracitricarpa]
MHACASLVSNARHGLFTIPLFHTSCPHLVSLRLLSFIHSFLFCHSTPPFLLVTLCLSFLHHFLPLSPLLVLYLLAPSRPTLAFCLFFVTLFPSFARF